MSKPRVEQVTEDFTAFWWESWCRAHPLPNGDTGVAFDRWEDAVAHAIAHGLEHH